MNSTWIKINVWVWGLMTACAISGCGGAGMSGPASAANQGGAEIKPWIGRVFFAQQHVLEPTSPYFKLVGDLEALVKVQVYAEKPVDSPEVYAVLTLEGRTMDVRLRGPDVLPRPYTGDPVLMPQRYDDSFTAMIPGPWIKPGLQVSIELRRYDYQEAQSYTRQTHESKAVNSIHVLDRKELGKISVGAPSKLVMNMFDIHYFGLGMGADYPTGWEEEFKARLPISELVLHRVKDIVFDKIVWQPMAGHPSMLISSPEEYQQRTGMEIDGEQAMALAWGAALKRAAGSTVPWRLYYVSICGMQAGGQARGFQGCGSIHRNGVIIHEVGHTLGLPHWGPVKNYPYKSSMYGQTAGEPAPANAGPTWGYDLHRRAFLPAYEKTAEGYRWATDPMQGGGRYPGPQYIFRHFSDYSVHRMQSYLEDRAVYWNEALGRYAKWNQETGAYDQVVPNDGLQLPIERETPVISVLVTANLVTPEANIIYKPIGPYTAGLIERFNAESADDRAKAHQLGFDRTGCNVCLRVTQGGKTTTYLMNMALSEQDDPLKTFHMGAINLPARDGDVTMAELLYTPDVITQGVTPNAKVLYTWRP